MPFFSTTYADLGTVSDKHGVAIATFRHYPSEQLLYIIWNGNLTGKEVIQVAKEGLKILEEFHIPLVLNDKTKATGDWSEALPWLEYEWLPDAMQEGLRAFAYIFSPDVQSHIVSAEFVEKIGKYLPIQLFYDMPSAMQWLQQQHKAA
ncbi:hypothetical protein [Hymenobacter sp. BT730]|uniref:hypothetical protein n=1 Tax=Hymenobacter sp. BT730 TaxID=3063332 RepID=UPI0026DEAC51|nr:hypothetical protein [Hymenobacter sp. BT730]